MAYSRGLSVYLLTALNHRFLVTRNTEPSELAIAVVAANALAHQSAAILHYKRKAEEAGMDGAIFCTSSLLQEQLEDCLSIWPESLPHFQNLAKTNQERGDLDLSMGLDAQFTHQLLAKSDTATHELPGQFLFHAPAIHINS